MNKPNQLPVRKTVMPTMPPPMKVMNSTAGQTVYLPQRNTKSFVDMTSRNKKY